MEAQGIALPVIEAHCAYRQPARYDDEVRIGTRAGLLTPIRIRFDYELSVAGSPVVSAAGHTVHAAIGRDGRPCRLPPELRRLIGP
jgi:acyl-CoA thioester hydrolase